MLACCQACTPTHHRTTHPPMRSQALVLLLEPPFPEQRAAVYRFIAALGLRSWFAAEVRACARGRKGGEEGALAMLYVHGVAGQRAMWLLAAALCTQEPFRRAGHERRVCVRTRACVRVRACSGGPAPQAAGAADQGPRAPERAGAPGG